jgi:Na+/H+ antiporter 1
VLLGAALAALVRVNVHPSSYEELWETTLSIDLGSLGVSLSLREWVNSGLMTIVFFILGLEARRELDLGELRERRRFALPLLAAHGGMVVPVTSTCSSTSAARPRGAGGCDVDRHRLRARPARTRGTALPRSPARVLAYGRCRRRRGAPRRRDRRLARGRPSSRASSDRGRDATPASLPKGAQSSGTFRAALDLEQGRTLGRRRHPSPAAGGPRRGGGVAHSRTPSSSSDCRSSAGSR